MKVCKTIEEFIYEYEVNDCSFNDLTFENEEQYIELYNYCIVNQDKAINLLVLGNIFYNGKGVKPNLEKAFYWFEQSAKAGNSDGMKNLAICYEQGIGCTPDAIQAFYWYEQSAKAGNADGMNNLGLCYENGIGCTPDKTQAFYWYEQAAALEEEYAMCNLGYCYEKGIGCCIDLEKAFIWYKKSAEKNHERAMCNLGYCYEKGIGCTPNKTQAFYWYQKSAELGNASAMNNLGLCYENGTGCEKDEAQAFNWYEQAAALQEEYAMNNLGICYEKGIGCTPNKIQAFYWFQKSAELGNASAMRNLGLCYENGTGCEKNLTQAFYWYQKSAELGNLSAMNNLGLCYEYGDGCEKDLTQAFYWYQKSAELGNKFAMNNLGLCYEYGDGCEKDLTQAFKWYQKSVELGNPSAMINLGHCYTYGDGCEKDLAQAFYWYQKSAELGNASAMLNLGLCYEYGDGCEKDLAQAFYWYQKSADLGNARAMRNLGLCYEYGDGCEKDLTQAFYWYQKSAELGNARAMLNLGLCYTYGDGCEKDLAQAFYWYQKSAELGNASAMRNLGLCYENGDGCEKDLTQAFYWYEQSATAGNSDGMFGLAICYEEGIGCNSDETQAFYWYQKSAESGNASAMCNLGACYEYGDGCEKDLTQAFYWYQKSAELGLETARENYERLLVLIEEEESKNSNLHYSSRKDVFISWNHLDLKEKDEICENLESRNIFTVWESDGNGVGDIKRSIQNAILQAKSYIVILTGNSINSKWVEEEVKIILEKVKSNPDYVNVIRPVIIDKITKEGKEEKFDVISAIKEKEEGSIFKELLDYCASFEDTEVGVNFDKVANTIKEAISNSLKIEYRTKLVNKFDKFSAALNSVVSSRQTATGIIAATLEFEKGYLNRSVYDNSGNKYNPSDLLLSKNPCLIYGEGGSGKSLYLKNFIRKEFKNNKYIFYLECKELVDLVETNSFMEILKAKSFDNYFTLGEAEFVTLKSFEEFITSRNQIILLIDALDELLLEKREKLINKLQDFLNKVPSCKVIFTSRNILDAGRINSSLHKSIDTYELKGLTFEEIDSLYDNLSSKYQAKENVKVKSTDKEHKGSEIENNQTISKEAFFKQLENIGEEIKKNPLLISNLIFIYFATNKLPNSSFDIITEAITILLNDLEEERNVNFKYMKYIANDNLYNLLGQFALLRSYGDGRTAEELIKEYLEEKVNDNIDYGEVADAIYKYLRGRAVIVNENISHEIFKNYFAAMYIFKAVYKLATKNPLKKKYYTFEEEGLDYLNSWCEDYFVEDNQTWNNIAIDLLYKLDFEIYNLDTKKEMNEKHLSYEAFSRTLIRALKEKGFNPTIISVLEKLLNNDSFHYNEFIKKYI